MILDAYGRPVGGESVSLWMVREGAKYFEREKSVIKAYARIADLRESVGVARVESVGQTIRVKLPERYR